MPCTVRTSSRLVTPATPTALPMPPPLASSTSARTSVVFVSSKPVYSVTMWVVALWDGVVMLFGPLYWAGNVGCHWNTTLACPEIQQRVGSGWGEKGGG